MTMMMRIVMTIIKRKRLKKKRERIKIRMTMMILMTGIMRQRKAKNLRKSSMKK